jgi:DNA-binding response OmpR family regulator
MKKPTKIFLVEDDPNFGAVLKSYLELNDFYVEWVKDGELAYLAYKQDIFDLCILDIMIPHIDGFEVARIIRDQHPDIPLIFLTAKKLKEDVLRGFQLGADDYIVKPFDSEVLIYKIKAILKRSDKAQPDQKQKYAIGDYTFLPLHRTLVYGQEEKKLSPKESMLLEMLCLSMNGTLSREEALNRIWGDDNYFTTRSMDVFISKLRKYLKEDPNIELINVHGSGYRLIVKE